LRSPRAVLAAAVLLAAAVVLVSGHAPPAASAEPAARPNIVLVLTDDMTADDLQWMPITRQVIGDSGVAFDQYFVNDPSCCPSRVTMLTGKYAHNTGVYTNGGTNGGFETAHARGLEEDTVATRLQRAGYRTGLFGKYLNGYPNGVAPEWVPPGWTRWVSPVAGEPYSEYNYALNVDGHVRQYGATPADYGTTVYARAARAFLRDSAQRGSPFFAALTVYAPHLPAVAAPQDDAAFPHARAPRTPNFDQRDVSASPSFVRNLPRFNKRTIKDIDSLYRDRIRSLQAVDREVGALVDAARDAGVLDNTYFVFTSDNGFHLGQHRLPAGKYTAYDPDIHVPLLVRGPGIPAGAHVDALAGNVDLAPTFEAMAGVRPPSATDGSSLLDLARDPAKSADWGRTAFLIEHRTQTGNVKRAGAEDLPLEPSDPEAENAGDGSTAPPAQTVGPTTPTADVRAHRPKDKRLLRRSRGVPDYDAVRTTRWLYVEYANGQRELYDLRADPDELVNLAGRGHVSVEATLHRRLDALRNCAGATCQAPTVSAAGAG
jgi:N-acetylglucosamine-6-sulfatase